MRVIEGGRSSSETIETIETPDDGGLVFTRFAWRAACLLAGLLALAIVADTVTQTLRLRHEALMLKQSADRLDLSSARLGRLPSKE